MKKNKRAYHSKVLLFGEYLVLEQAQALAMPLKKFKGNWGLVDNPKIKNPYFKEMLELLSFFQDKKLNEFLDLKGLADAIQSGLIFNSNIRNGYGTGSSGALIAGIYDQYLFDNAQTDDFVEIRQRLSVMESFFHGKSSGVDPLISFYDTPLLVDQDGSIGQVHIPSQSCSFYLLDSEVSRSTQPFVDIYNEKKRDTDFESKLLQPLKEASNRAIKGFLQGDLNFLSNMEILSRLQFEGFKEMILPSFVPLWEKGLKTGDFYLKLCGAGGGGYYLAIGSEQHILDDFKGTAIKLF